MKSLKTMTGDSLEQIIDYKVVDQAGDPIGSLHSLWSDPSTGAVEFLGVKTGWLFGHNHVVPADKAELDEANNLVRLPYEEAFIKEAPSISADSEISESQEEDIYRYYGSVRAGAMVGGVTDTLYGDASNIVAGSVIGETTLTDARTEPVDYSTSSSANAVATDSELLGGDKGAASTAPNSDASAARWRKFSGAGDKSKGVAASVSDFAGAESTLASNLNPDPISGEPGAHPVGTGVGATGGGVAGATIGGAVGGPVGAVVGSIAGAVGGGLAGKGVAESVDPTTEAAYWQDNYRNASYYENGQEYSEYAPAYRVGYEGFGRYGAEGRSYTDAEPDLEKEYMNAKGASSLGWEKAKAATRDAWERLKAKTANVVS